jgi:hypothetical protein
MKGINRISQHTHENNSLEGIIRSCPLERRKCNSGSKYRCPSNTQDPTFRETPDTNLQK